MASELSALRVAAADPRSLTRFWAALLGRDTTGGVRLPPPGGAGFGIHFEPERAPKTGQNPMHFDLTSTSWDQQRQTVAHALDLGARHVDVGQLPEEKHVVLADPAGNEFCVIEPGNNFLAGCGFIGALACDGSRQVGHFWAAALGWPLVWDQDEETAIQSPRGGTKISWGGPPLMPRTGPARLRLELTAPAGTGHRTELARLLALGATLDAGGQLRDPDGTEFHLHRHDTV